MSTFAPPETDSRINGNGRKLIQLSLSLYGTQYFARRLKDRVSIRSTAKILSKLSP